jgi:general secretion pathway protein A
MYKEFYGFTTYPFSLTPDPQFLYPSGPYRQCWYYLLYGLEQEHGLLALIGDIGTGKTFLLNTLMTRLGEKTHVAFLVHSSLAYMDILRYASQEFGLETTGKSKAELLTNLENFLLTCAMKNEKAVLIIDDAQNLSVDVLEELRLLTNFESHEKKLLQIILAGQLQLEDKLKLPELAQLNQRLGFYGRLTPMNYHETKGYIEKRLAIAGVVYPIFTPKAIKKIFVYSKGVPRVINQLCDLALYGFINGKHEIGPTMIQQVMQEFNFSTPTHSMRRSTRSRSDAQGVHANSIRRPRRLALVAGMVAFSLLSAGVVLQARRMLRADTTRSGPSPAVVSPQQPAWSDQPSLPPSPYRR